MPLDIYTPQQLLAVMFDEKQVAPTNHWRNMFFSRTVQSAQEEIMFNEIAARRPIAPFMLPNLPGRPIAKKTGETIKSFRPAYTKPKDAIRPGELLTITPGEITRRIPLQTPEARYNREVVRVLGVHRDAIERNWDYLCARAIIDAAVTISYAGDQGVAATTVTLDFGRASGHTVALAAAARWGATDVNPLTSIEAGAKTMAAAAFGGAPDMLILGASAAVPFLASTDIKDLMDTNYRGGEGNSITRGMVVADPMNPFTRLGTLTKGGAGGLLEVFLYSGPSSTFQKDNDEFVNIMDPRDALLVAPAARMGVMAFGAIVDADAMMQPIPIFPKMFRQDDPSATFIMTQSAPLAIPVYPDATYKMRVVA